MKATVYRLLALLGVVSLFVATASTGESPAILAIGGAMALAAAVLAAAGAVLAARALDQGLGARGWRRDQSRLAQPEPQHPDTAGRPRSRAPSRRPAAA